MDLSRSLPNSVFPWEGGADKYTASEAQGLRSNKENLQRMAGLIHKLEKLSAQIEAILLEN